MKLTEEDLAAIRAAIQDEVIPMIDGELEPIRDALKKMVQSQIIIVDDIHDLKLKMGILTANMVLPASSSELRTALKALD